MQPLFTLLQKKTQKTSRTTERGELMKWFMDILNPARIHAGYKPLTYPRMASLIAKIPTKDLYYMKSMMSDKNTEQACKWFYWSLKEQK